MPAADRISPAIAVVVDLPCVPAIATPIRDSINCPSICG